MLSDYVTWWVTEMLRWVPARFMNRGSAAVHGLIIEPSGQPIGQGVELVLRGRRGDRNLGRFDLDGIGLRSLHQAVIAHTGQTIVLRLPPALLLEREVVLPLAAEREPERVLSYEMDRLTPFASNEIFWAYAIERRDRARGRLHLRLSFVTNSAVQALLASLTQAGIGPTLLEVSSPAGTVCRIALQHPDSRYARIGRRVSNAMASVCAVLAVAAVALPFILQSVAAGRIDKRISTLRPLVTEAEALRHRIAINAAGTDIVESERVRVGDALTVLATLTTLLPDDTYLTDFAMRQGKLTLNGQSGAAVRLIAALSGDPVIRNPEFIAPVTRFDNRADLFSIRAEVSR